jgi:hypothetical protein
MQLAANANRSIGMRIHSAGEWPSTDGTAQEDDEPARRNLAAEVGKTNGAVVLITRPAELFHLAERRKPPGSGANAYPHAAKNVGVEVSGSTITSSGSRAGRLTPLRSLTCFPGLPIV